MTSRASAPCIAVVVCSLFAIQACGDDSGGDEALQEGSDGGTRDASPSGGGSGRGTFRAVVDGMAWEATPASVRARVDEDVPGGYELQGNGGGGVLSQIRLSFFYVESEGTYDFGVSGTVVGAGASYSRGSSIWQAPATGDAGKLTITKFEDGRIAGTFAFEVVPVPGSQATGMHRITDGEFDLEFEGEPRPIEASLGRSLSAEFGGKRFNAATVVVTPIKNGISFNALNNDYNMGLIFDDVDGPGTYEISLGPPARVVSVVAGSLQDKDEHCCWGNLIADSGSLALTTFSAERLAGSFEFTLAPDAKSAAGAPLVITAGVFDIGRQDP